MIGTAAALIVLLILGLVLFYSCGEKSVKTRKKTVRNNISEKIEKKEELPEFIRKKEFYPTGEVKAVYYVYREKPEIRHKQYTGYYKTGERKLEYTYDNNVKEGALHLWYKDGKTAMEGAFAGNEREGEFKEFHPDGSLKLTYQYKNGLLEGLWTEYYEDGKTKMIEKEFSNGKLNGAVIHYKADGTEKFHRYY